MLAVIDEEGEHVGLADFEAGDGDGVAEMLGLLAVEEERVVGLALDDGATRGRGHGGGDRRGEVALGVVEVKAEAYVGAVDGAGVPDGQVREVESVVDGVDCQGHWQGLADYV